MSWHVDFDNGDLFSFKSEAEARAFYRGFQYAKRLALEAAHAVAAAEARQPLTTAAPRVSKPSLAMHSPGLS